MSAAPRQPVPQAYTGARMNADQFFAMGETDARLELVHGVVVTSPSPHPLHQRVLHLIQVQLGLLQANGLRIEVFPDTDVTFEPDVTYCPDLSVYLASRLPRIPDRLMIPPEFILEILSPSNKPMDLITKREDYESYGVPEYVVVDPHRGRSNQWVRRGTIYHEVPPVGDTISSDAIPGLTIDLRPVRALAKA